MRTNIFSAATEIIHMALLNVHKERVDNIDITAILGAFVLKDESRRKIFGFNCSADGEQTGLSLSFAIQGPDTNGGFRGRRRRCPP
jgi:hypothetical protein